MGCICGGRSRIGDTGIEPSRPRDRGVPADEFLVEGDARSISAGTSAADGPLLRKGIRYRIVNLDSSENAFYRKDGETVTLTNGVPDNGVNALQPGEGRLVLGDGRRISVITNANTATVMVVPLRRERDRE